MAGYNGFSKSNNAVAAEQSGLMVASKLAKHAAQCWPRLRGVTAADVEAELRPAEWHHTSKMFNRVNYFSPESLCERGTRGRLYRRVLARRAAKFRQPITLTGCTVEWLEWGGTRSHPKAIEMKSAGCTVTFKPGSSLVSVAAPEMRYELRKRLDTRGFRVTAADGSRVWENPCGK